MTNASTTRITRFIDAFIRREDIHPDVQELLLSDPDRADRMYTAAEEGADGSTHAEVIQDWRDAFARFLRSYHDCPRFEAAVLAHFDAIEQWHQNNGSLYQEIG